MAAEPTHHNHGSYRDPWFLYQSSTGPAPIPRMARALLAAREREEDSSHAQRARWRLPHRGSQRGEAPLFSVKRLRIERPRDHKTKC